jgi:predicted methyltransferase
MTNKRGIRAPFAALALLPLLAWAAACAHAQAPQPKGTAPGDVQGDTMQKLELAIDGNWRPAKERARDKYRHPLETLTFFGLRDDMTVVELWPGGGWYSAILAPILSERGKLIAVNYDLKGTGEFTKNYDARLKSLPAVFGKVDEKILRPNDDFSFGPDESADLVVTFRNIHNWIGENIMGKVFVAVWRVLKPGGVFGVEEHRAPLGADPGKAPNTGYVPEAYVIKTLEAAGFKLDGKSDINANPKDTKDYPEGVWTLPPSLAQGDFDKDKYLAIGESDRMTLKFVKVPK